MGLDMYIFEGEPLPYDENSRTPELAYWRKHPDLHGAIVQSFAGGVDECQPIPLKIEDLESLIFMTKKNILPETDGFFFGKSEESDKGDTIAQLERIKEMMVKDPEMKIYYQASW